MINVRKIRDFKNGSCEMMIISNNTPYIVLCSTGYEDGDWRVEVFSSRYDTESGNMIIMPNTIDSKISFESEDREAWEDTQEYLFGNFEELVG